MIRTIAHHCINFSLLITILGASPGVWGAARGDASRDAQPRPIAPRGAFAADEQTNISLFRAASPSVVHINTVELQRNLFTFDVMQVPRGTGTGFMWDEHGHIVTNFHVIQGASAAIITLSDQTTLKAVFVGGFPDRDLAVLKIDAPKNRIRPIPLGESRDLQVGQKVYAIGNPFGFDQTLTTGIVSALNREIASSNQRTIRGVIQTDAAINPGNSGGPLLDSSGRLIGVNTAIFSPSGASVGIGFAIPVDEVNRIVPRLIRDGKFIRPTLGVQGAPEQLIQALKLPKGVAVVGVVPGSPAQKAGLVPFTRAGGGAINAGDVIVAINGKPVASFDDMLTILEQYNPGDDVSVTTQRGGKRVDFNVRLAAPN